MIRNKVTLKQIEALVYVADLGTFRKAAAALGTTQPNISVRISALEETLQTVLMQRDSGSIQLTAKGAEVLEAAREVLRSTEILLEVADRRDLVEERLRLGVSELIAATWLRPYLRTLKDAYPSLRVELVVDLAREIETQLISGNLDLTISNAPFRSARFEAFALGTSPFGWVASADIAASLGPAPDLPDVFAKGILAHEKQTQAPKQLRDRLTELGQAADHVVHSSSLSALANMAADGLGVALLPRDMFDGRLEQDKLVEVHCNWVPDPMHFFARFDASKASRFVQAAAALAKGFAFLEKDKEN